ncbi:MAG: zinc ribbon domain-containing protein [Treponema sp.]|jgi:predicted RNA-binding Zn-ribbon protein involved in translation (DUF1610 family)|nr:zinc ribbon domain-containing protein [Treponema sp.]
MADRTASGGGKPGARFFCENCGAEVNRGAAHCPSCGRVFESVRCPSCGFTAAEWLFREGCPVCGYCAAPGGGSAVPGRQAPRGREKPPRRFLISGLPVWVYILAFFALAAVILALFLEIQ